jgi:hypothetical protein
MRPRIHFLTCWRRRSSTSRSSYRPRACRSRLGQHERNVVPGRRLDGAQDALPARRFGRRPMRVPVAQGEARVHAAAQFLSGITVTKDSIAASIYAAYVAVSLAGTADQGLTCKYWTFGLATCGIFPRNRHAVKDRWGLRAGRRILWPAGHEESHDEARHRRTAGHAAEKEAAAVTARLGATCCTWRCSLMSSKFRPGALNSSYSVRVTHSQLQLCGTVASAASRLHRCLEHSTATAATISVQLA